MGARDDGSTTIEPLGGSRVVEGSRLGVKLHVSRVDTRAIHPGVVDIVLSALDQQDLEIVVQVGQPWQESACLVSI
jgi:hypothetical protein